MNRDILFSYNAYTTKRIEVELFVIRNDKMLLNSDINEIRSKLVRTLEYKKIYFPDRPDEFFKGYVDDIIVERVTEQVSSVVISFSVQPFKYLIDGEQTLIISKATTLNNPGTYYSEAYFKVYGSGTVTLTINDDVVIFNDVVNYIELDSEELNCYKDSIDLNNKMIGDFPLLVEGDNAISFTNAIKIEITPKWRCL